MAKRSLGSSILVIDSTRDNYGYLLDSSKRLSLVRFGENDSLLKKAKPSRVLSYLPLSGNNVDNKSYKTIYYPMQILKTEEDPEEFIVSKLYNEYPDKMENDENYIIKFVPTVSASPNHIDYDIFTYFDNDLSTKYSVCLKDTEYIDEIYPEPFLYKALYSKGVLKPIGTDIFVYLDKDKITITAYQAGEYLTYYESSQLRLSAVKMAYNNETHENMSEDAFIMRATTEGFDFTFDGVSGTNFKFGNLFEHYFSGHTSLFAMIERICKRKNIASLNNIIISSYCGTINGFSQRVALQYKGVAVVDFKDLELNLTINNLNDFYREKDKKLISKIQQNKISSQANSAMDGGKSLNFDLDMNIYTILTLLWAQSDDAMDKYVDVNVTLFARPPKFLKRRSGQIISIGILALCLAFVFPIGAMIFDNIMESNTLKNQEEARERNSIILNSKNKIEAANKYKEEIYAKLKESKNRLRFEQDLINQINEKKNYYLVKSKCLNKMSSLLNKHSVRLKQLDYEEKAANKTIHMRVHGFDSNITAFMKELIEEKYGVENKLIEQFDDKSHEANIIVKIKDNSCN